MLGSRPEAAALEQVQQGEPTRGEHYGRVFDVAVATLLLVLVSPVLLLVAIAIIVEDGGPVLFFQKRVGRNKEIFRLCKFRSMAVGADEYLHQRHVVQAVNGSTTLRLVPDPRVTRVGKFIRRWSLDELPNLWNVVRGDMSLVGPRPLVPYEADAVAPSYDPRFSVRPGVTGLAQVSGRLDLTHEERLDLDLTYAHHRSLLVDCKILAKTVPTMLRTHG